MKRQSLVVPPLALGLILGGIAFPAWSQDSISDVVIFATNSAHLSKDTAVESGVVVVNDASDGPTLDAGVELSLDRNATVAGAALADSIVLDNGASIGTVECNQLDSIGVTCLGLSLPVLSGDQVPVFQEAALRGEDVFVGDGDTATLPAGDYADITIGNGGTLFFSGGTYNIGSLMQVTTSGGQCPFPCRSLVFQGPTELRILGMFDSGTNSFVGPAGEPALASNILIYVGATNLVASDPNSFPPAARVGRGSTVEANFYVPNGTFLLERESDATGAFLARDVEVDRESTVNLASAFNLPPTADPQDVFTSGTAPEDITLTGSDPEGEPLTFSIESLPAAGSLSDGATPITTVPTTLSGSTVTYTASQAGDLEDSFIFRVTDPNGGFDEAVISINPFDDGEDPPTPTGAVVAKDDSLEMIAGESVDINLVAFADVADPESVGDFSFSITAGPTAGSLTAPVPSVPDATDLAPPVPEELFASVRTAEVTFTAPATDGISSFDFQVCGDLNGDQDTADPGECDTGTISITFGAETPPQPPVAEDLTIKTPVDVPVVISLDGETDDTPQPRSSRTWGPVVDLPHKVTIVRDGAGSTAGVETAVTVDGGYGSRAATGPLPGSLVALPQKATPKSLDDDLFFADTDKLFMSVDGGGSLSSTYTVEVEKPNASASVSHAFLLAASTGGSSHVIADGEITLQGVGVSWDATVASGISSNNYRADVTTTVKPIVDAAAAGRVAFTVGEGSNSLLIDGVVLAVVFEDPSQCADQTVLMLFGAQVPSGDSFAITFAPIDPAASGAVADMGLADSFGAQPGCGTASQTNIVDVNGQRLTSAAGGEDDGECGNGALITVGGLDDSNANPTDPNAGPSDAFSDDELYSLLPFITANTTSIIVDTTNPSLDDNVFFAYFQLSQGACPDLIVSSLTHDPANPDSATEIDFSAVVENIGDAPAIASSMCFAVGDESCTTHPTETTWSVPSLDPGESFEVLRAQTLPADCDDQTGVCAPKAYQSTGIADIGGVVDESDENNNVAIDTFVVTEAEEVTQLTFTILSLPLAGTLFNSTGAAITSVPTVVPDGTVTYQSSTAGTASFTYEVATQFGTDTGTVAITNFDFTAVIPEVCEDGRELGLTGAACMMDTDCCSGSCTSGTCE